MAGDTHKVFPLIWFTVKQECSSWKAIALRITLYYIIIYIFSLTFQSVTSKIEHFYYVGLTQVLIESYAPASLAVYAEMQSDLFAIRCIKPLHYVVFQTITGLSQFIVRFIILIMAFYVFVKIRGGLWPLAIDQLCFFAVSGFLGAIIYHFLTLIIGLSSYWMKDVKTLFWLNFTTTFFLGGGDCAACAIPTKTADNCVFYPISMAAKLPGKWFVGNSFTA